MATLSLVSLAFFLFFFFWIRSRGSSFFKLLAKIERSDGGVRFSSSFWGAILGRPKSQEWAAAASEPRFFYTGPDLHIKCCSVLGLLSPDQNWQTFSKTKKCTETIIKRKNLALNMARVMIFGQRKKSGRNQYWNPYLGGAHQRFLAMEGRVLQIHDVFWLDVS